MGRYSLDGNASFGHFWIPENLPLSPVKVVSMETDSMWLSQKLKPKTFVFDGQQPVPHFLFRNVACLIGMLEGSSNIKGISVPLSLGIDDRQGNSFHMT